MQHKRASIALATLVTLMAVWLCLWGLRFDMPATPTAAKSTATIAHPGSVAEKTARVLPQPTRTQSPSIVGTNARAVEQLPQSEVSLKAILGDLQEKANAGDAAAASRLFYGIRHCARVRRVNEVLTEPPLPTLPAEGQSIQDYERQNREAQSRRMEESRKFVRDNATFCANLNDDDYDQDFPMSRLAAMAGDTVAAGCYLEFGMTGGKHATANHADWIADYKQNALTVASVAIQRGDWTAVEILEFAYQGRPEAELLSQIAVQDDVQDYRFSKLLSFGPLEEPSRIFYDRLIAELAMKIGTDAQRDADAWALDTYQRYFSANRPPESIGPLYACRVDDL